MKRLYFALLVCLGIFVTSAASRMDAADSGSPVYEYKELDARPTLVRPVRVRFPYKVRKKGKTVEIVLRFVVTKTGDVDKLTVVRFSDPDMIDPAVRSYQHAKFKPGKKAGAAVDAWMEVTETAPAK